MEVAGHGRAAVERKLKFFEVRKDLVKGSNTALLPSCMLGDAGISVFAQARALVSVCSSKEVNRCENVEWTNRQISSSCE